MMLFRSLLRRLILLVSDFWLALPSFIEVHVLGAHRASETLHDSSQLTEQHDVAIVAMFQPRGLMPSTRRLLEAFRRRKVAVILVSNAPLPDVELDYLKSMTMVVLQRKNIGRDFGAYQCGLRFLANKNYEIEKLFLVNDSIYILPGIDNIIEKIQKAEDKYQGLTEIYEYHYHLASHFVALDKTILEDEQFKNFWNGYKPLSTRKHAIWKGEVGLTQALINGAGIIPNVLFNANDLRAALSGHSHAVKLQDIFKLSPIPYARDPNYMYLQIRDLFIRLASQGADSEPSASANQSESQPNCAKTNSQLAFVSEMVCEDVVSYGELRNQSHMFALLFVKYLQYPVLKRDICQRGVYEISTVVQFLSEYLSQSEVEAIEKDLRAKAYPVSVHGLRRFLFDNGRI